MLRNYLITAVRSLFRQKGFSLINILGLAIGLASALLIAILTVSYQAARAALTNPADALRYE